MSNQLQITGGAKVRALEGVITGTAGILGSVPLGAANGVATLDSGGKVPVSQLPSSVVTYLGTWNAATNTPTLTNGVGDAGDMYICNVAGTVNFGAGPVTFAVGDWVLYGSGTWQKSNGQNGTVTSVGATITGGAIGITGSPITTAGTLTFAFAGTSGQYVNGAGNLTTFPTLITSIGLSMPSAFSVSNSPLTANGTIAVTGAGYASQYIRGDGTLADFPSSGGGGSSVSYYLNGGTSQGTIGGTTYYEMSKTADTGTMVDFTKSGDGFIVAFLTDANDPSQLNIPAGNWNYEIYASMSSNGGTPQLHAELYVYNGTTFTLISTSSNEILYDGTNLNLYSFAMTVPATTLALTDRLAIKLYATNSGGKTTTIHTQDSHLCQVITTFSTGITALNGLTAQVQYFQTGTSGTDFNISSTTATHTFNIPDASATARGLITTGTQTIAGTKTFSDATKNNGGIFLQNASSSSLAGYMNLGGLTNGVKFTSGGGVSNSFTLPSATGYTFTFPNATGTLALTSDISYPVTSVFGRTGAVVAAEGDYSLTQLSDVTITSPTSSQLLQYNGTSWVNWTPNYITGNQTITLSGDVSGSGTTAITTTIGALKVTNAMLAGSIDLTTKVTGILPIANGGTGSSTKNFVDLTSNQSISGTKTFSVGTKYDGGILLNDSTGFGWVSGYIGLAATNYLSNKGLIVNFGSYQFNLYFNATSSYSYTFPNATGTIALTSDLTGGTVTSVAALTIGTSGTDLSSSVATSTTTPVITLNVPTASATNRGALSSADWSAFNSKQGTITLTTTGTSGAATFTSNTLNIPNYGSALSGYLPLTGGTLTGALNGTSASFSSSLTATNGTFYLGDAINGTYFLGGSGNTARQLKFSTSTTTNVGDTHTIDAQSGTGVLQFATTSSVKMTLNNSGNLGLGVTPSAWNSGTKALQINGGSIYAANTYTFIGSNAVYSDTGDKYINTGFATVYGQLSGEHRWYNAPSGTAGAAITFTQAMTLTAAGRLLINTPTESTYQLDVNGTGRFGDQLTIKTPTSSTAIALWGRSTDNYSAIRFQSNTGANTYATIYTNASDLIFENNGSARLTIASTGAATFSSSVTASGGFFQGNGSFTNNGFWGTLLTAGTGSYSDFAIIDNTSTQIMRVPTGTRDVVFSSSVSATSFFEVSDKTQKTLIQDNVNIKGIENILAKTYIKNDKQEIGYFAQDLKGVLDSSINIGENGLLSLSYTQVHTAKISSLESRVKYLEEKLMKYEL